jgi:ATP-dependent Clp protease ATP-binding subunit ClpA
MKKFVEVNYSPMLIGNAGCGKTQITKGLLNDLCNPAKEQFLQ